MTMLWWVVESAVRLTLLAGLVASALWALRVTSAETRLRVWTTVIAASFLLPFLPDQWVVPISVGIADAMSSSVLVTLSSAASDTGDSTGLGLLSSLNALTIVLLVYAIGVIVLLARLVFGWSWAKRLTREATPVAGRAFLESALVHVPVTVGFLRPRIIVPDTWRSWPEDMLAAVLAHEGAHASRRDGLCLTLALLHRAIQWINPISWWMARHMATLSERASDDAALVRGVRPTRYAEIVLSFATAVATRHRRVAWIVAMARPSGRDTERRLDRVLTWKGRAEMSRSRLMLLGLILVAVSAAVYTATIANLSAFPPDSPVLSRFTPVQFPAEPAVLPVTKDTATDRLRRDKATSQKAEPVVVQPVATKRVDPKYTPDAMRAKIQGIVTLLVVIDAKGVVKSATVAESLDAEYGLDANAIDAVMQWTFLPGTINGVATPFSVKVAMEFRLHD